MVLRGWSPTQDRHKTANIRNQVGLITARTRLKSVSQLSSSILGKSVRLRNRKAVWFPIVIKKEKKTWLGKWIFTDDYGNVPFVKLACFSLWQKKTKALTWYKEQTAIVSLWSNTFTPPLDENWLTVRDVNFSLWMESDVISRKRQSWAELQSEASALKVSDHGCQTAVWGGLFWKSSKCDASDLVDI